MQRKMEVLEGTLSVYAMVLHSSSLCTPLLDQDVIILHKNWKLGEIVLVHVIRDVRLYGVIIFWSN